jgi:hypothetical protein
MSPQRRTRDHEMLPRLTGAASATTGEVTIGEVPFGPRTGSGTLWVMTCEYMSRTYGEGRPPSSVARVQSDVHPEMYGEGQRPGVTNPDS